MENPQLCYIMYSDETSANTAMETLNGQEIGLVRIRITESEENFQNTNTTVVHRKRQKV